MSALNTTPSVTTGAPGALAGPATVVFVGSGPGDPGLMTVRGRDLLATADVIVLDGIACRDDVAAVAREGAEIVDAAIGGDGQELSTALRAKAVLRAAKALPDGGLLVRLMDGDPAVFNGLADETRVLRAAGISYDVVPGVSAATAVATYAGVPLTSKVVSAIDVVPAEHAAARDWARHAGTAGTLVVLGSADALVTAARRLTEHGMDPDTEMLLVERGTTVEQRSVRATLRTAGKAIGGRHPLAPTAAIVSPNLALSEQFEWFETKPLFGWRVLIPRTQAQAGPALERLALHGGTGQVVPTISIEPPRTPQQMERAVAGLVNGRYEWVGFTSVNAVKAVREEFQKLGLDARAFAGLKIAAVGGVTAAALEQWGIRADLVPSGEQSAAGLLADWPEYDEVLDPIRRVLLPRADIATDALIEGLTELGWEVDDVTAYRTVRAAPPPIEVRNAIKQGEFDAVLFTSSSTVRNLVGIAGKPAPSTVVACIGPATAQTATELGLRVDVIAPVASIDSLVDALAAHGRSFTQAALDSGQAVRRPRDRRPVTRRRKS